MATFARISIITPCLNRGNYIGDAIESVASQSYPEIEHIIVDGGSTDKTLEILAEHPYIKIISGPDQGMYDALNKGLELASGEIIGFLNSDDLYAKDVFFDIEQIFKDRRIVAVAGEAIVFRENIIRTENPVIKFSPHCENILQLSTVGNPFFNAWFFRKAVFDNIGKFDINYRIVADREFMLRFALGNMNYTAFNKLVYQYRQHAGSMTFDITDQKFERIANEHIKMTSVYLQKKYLPKPTRALIQQLRTRDTIEMTILSLKTKNLAKSYNFFIAGIRYDPMWPIKFCQKIVHYLKRSLKPKS